MEIQHIGNTNFNGGFRIKNISTEAKKEIPGLFKKGKQIFEDFETKGDVFVVLRDNHDRKMAKFIQDNKLNIEYYPTINCKSGLDSEKPELLSALIKTIKEKPITTMSQINKALKLRRREEYIAENAPAYTNNILKALMIDSKGLTSSTNRKGITKVVDSEYSRSILISPPAKYDIHYVLVEPNSPNLPGARYSIDSNGVILAKYDSVESIAKFRKHFAKTLIK